jgi:hypothetical protein
MFDSCSSQPFIFWHSGEEDLGCSPETVVGFGGGAGVGLPHGRATLYCVYQPPFGHVMTFGVHVQAGYFWQSP